MRVKKKGGLERMGGPHAGGNVLVRADWMEGGLR
jgi:hypothetical protein